MTFDYRPLIPSGFAIRILAASCAAIFFLFLLPVILRLHFNVPVEYLIKPPAALFYAYPLVGLIPNICILIWCSTAAVCLFTAALLKAEAKISIFFLFSGLLTAILVLDEQFMLHQNIIPTYLHIPKAGVMLGYLILIASYLVFFRSFLMRHQFFLFVSALFFFAASVVCDLSWHRGNVSELIEDALQMIGMVLWFSYYIHYAFSHLQPHVRRSCIDGKFVN